MEISSLLSVAEVASLLSISRFAVLKRIKKGTLKAEQVGKHYVIRRRDLPLEAGGELTQEDIQFIDDSIARSVTEYGETLRLLGKE